MYRFIAVCLALIAIMYIFRCKAGGDFPGREYMPDMAHSRAYDIYYPGPGGGSEILEEAGAQQVDYLLFKDKTVARKPVAGTIPRGFDPYPYPESEDGYAASAAYVNPFTKNITNGVIPKDVLDRGENNYVIYCAVCHGEKGEGNGSISASNGGKFAGIPNYFAPTYMEMKEGTMFHSVHYGRNDMGSYAAQLNKEERWEVISYIKSLQQKKAKSQEKLDNVGSLLYVQGRKDQIARKPDGSYISSKLNDIKELKKGDKITLDNIFFTTGSAQLDAASYYELGILKGILDNNSKSKVEISGHTDNVGNPMANLNLSKSRSLSVYDYLIQNGISANQISSAGYGDTRPAAANDTPENMAKNRRVEFEVIR